MHIYKGKYTVLAPFWCIKRKQGRNWRTIFFILILWFSTLLLISWHSLTLFSHYLFCFHFLSSWRLCGRWGGKISPSAVYLFIASERLKVQGHAGFMKHDDEWKDQPTLKRNEGYYPRISFPINCPRMQCNIDCGSDIKIEGNLINTLSNPLRRSKVIRRNGPRWTFQHVDDAVSLM